MDKRKLLVEEWITKAEHDLGMAELQLLINRNIKTLFVFIANRALKNI